MGTEGTLAGNVDALRRNAELEEPPGVRTLEVHHGLAVGPAGEKPRRVAAEPGFNGLGHIVVRLKAAGADGGADGRAKLGGFRTEGAHGIHGVTENVGGRAAPAAVHRADGAVFFVPEQHGHAVGGEAEEGQAPFRRDDAVRLIGDRAQAGVLIRLCYDAHVVFMYLVGYARVVFPHAEQGADPAVVFTHGLGIVPPVGAEIEGCKLPCAHAAETGGKGVLCPDDCGAHID